MPVRRRPGRSSPRVRGARARAAACAQKRLVAAPQRAGTGTARRARASTPSTFPPYRRRRPAASKYASPGAAGSTAAPIPSSARQHRLPRARRALRVGRDQPQARAARERLADPHPGLDAERLRRPRDLTHDLRAVRLRCQRERLPQQLAPGPHRRQQLESGDEDADDHNRTYVRIRVKAIRRGTQWPESGHPGYTRRAMGGGDLDLQRSRCCSGWSSHRPVDLFAGTAGAATTNTNISSFADPRGDLPSHPGQLVRSTYGTFTSRPTASCTTSR